MSNMLKALGYGFFWNAVKAVENNDKNISGLHTNRYGNMPVKPGTELHTENSNTAASETNAASVGAMANMHDIELKALASKSKQIDDLSLAHSIANSLQISPSQNRYNITYQSPLDAEIASILVDPNSESRKLINSIVNNILDARSIKKAETHSKENTEIELEDLI